MSVLSEKTFDELEIRDTSDHTGATVFNGSFVVKTIIIENKLDQAVTFQCQASMHPDFSNNFDVGAEWDVPANTNDYQTCESYFPYWRLIASCASSPSSGDVTVHVLGVSA
ncbi:MAG: hypothetical protein JRJ45_00215 [Deltaproteobacteria bacterium]|nr:hypothetical protein [Deltaproteobacteria bacterium]